VGLINFDDKMKRVVWVERREIHRNGIEL